MAPRIVRSLTNLPIFLSQSNLLADCVPISQISRLGLNQHRQAIQFRGPREKAYRLAGWRLLVRWLFRAVGQHLRKTEIEITPKITVGLPKKCENHSSKLTKWLCDRRTARPTVLARSVSLMCGCCGRCGNKCACGNWFIQMKSQQEKLAKGGAVGIR